MSHLTTEVLAASLICSSAAAALFAVMVTSTNDDCYLNVAYMHNLLTNACPAAVQSPTIVLGSANWIFISIPLFEEEIIWFPRQWDITGSQTDTNGDVGYCVCYCDSIYMRTHDKV